MLQQTCRLGPSSIDESVNRRRSASPDIMAGMTLAVPPVDSVVPRPAPAAAANSVARRAPEQIRSDIRTQPNISAPGDFALTLQLLDRIEQLQQLSESMVRMVEAESGLRRSEFMVLRALEGRESHPRRIGRLVGLQTEAVLATAQSLATSGLLSVEHTKDGAVALILTAAGRSILSQAEAVQIRATDAAIQHVGPAGAQRAITVLDSLIAAMAPVAGNELQVPVSELRAGA